MDLLTVTKKEKRAPDGRARKNNVLEPSVVKGYTLGTKPGVRLTRMFNNPSRITTSRVEGGVKYVVKYKMVYNTLFIHS